MSTTSNTYRGTIIAGAKPKMIKFNGSIDGYEYRGKYIDRKEETPHGLFGRYSFRYKTDKTSFRYYAYTLAECLEKIDEMFQA